MKHLPTIRAALALMLLTIITGGLAALSPVVQTAFAGPGSGWVKADVVGGGCVETPSGTYCSSDVTPGSPTLYEYVPDRQGYDQGVGPGRPHEGDRTAELRDLCIYRGVNYGLAKGIWHHGARWTLTFRNGRESWQGPSNKHWAFQHIDQCRYDVAPTAVGPTATPYTNPQGTLVIPTNPPYSPPTITPGGFDASTPTPTAPLATPVPVCVRHPQTGMGVSATQGATVYRFGTAGYYVPEASMPGDPPGLYDDGVGAHVDPAWPISQQVGAVAASQPIDLAFDLTRPYQEFDRGGVIERENPLAPFSPWGGGKVFLTIIDRGANLGSAGDDVVIFRADSDTANPTKGTASPIQGGNPVVQIDRWDAAPGVSALGPQLWSSINWSTGRWFEQEHTTDPARGDYAPPGDAHWARSTPDIAAGRRYLRVPSVVGVRFTPQADHTYDVIAEVEARLCDNEWGHNYRLMRLANWTSATPTPVSLLAGPDVGIRQTAPRITTPGAEFTYRLIYDNTRDIASNSVTVTDALPAGVTLLGASPALSSQSGQTLTWSFPPLAPRASGEILVTVRVNQNAPESLLNVATIQMASDGNAANNRSEATTRVITAPAPQASFRLRIHSDLDPRLGIYTSSGTAVSWPAGEVMDFLPAITLQPAAQPADGAYRISHRIVAWSFVQLSGTTIGEPNPCKAGTEPTDADMDGADLTSLDGCVYRYLASPSVADMRGMAHAFWSQTPPAQMRDDVYVQTPLPQGTTQLALAYAVLTTAQENGVDLDGDGSGWSIIVRQTTVTRGAFQVTLLAPRSSR